MLAADIGPLPMINRWTPMATLSDVWPGQPPYKHLHVFVTLPGRARSPILVWMRFRDLVPTGLSSLLSRSNQSRRNTSTPHEAISVYPLVDCCVLWLKFSRTKMNATDIGCLFRLHVRPDLGDACWMIIRSLL